MQTPDVPAQFNVETTEIREISEYHEMGESCHPISSHDRLMDHHEERSHPDLSSYLYIPVHHETSAHLEDPVQHNQIPIGEDISINASGIISPINEVDLETNATNESSLGEKSAVPISPSAEDKKGGGKWTTEVKNKLKINVLLVSY